MNLVPTQESGAQVNADRKCLQRAWWTFVTAINIITEIGYVALFVWIIGKLQMPLLRRITILLVFLLRLLYVSSNPVSTVILGLSLPLLVSFSS